MTIPDVFELPASADFHVHLRDGEMLETVVPSIRHGGVDTFRDAKPNLVPPIVTVEHATKYHARLRALEPNVEFLMSLYLHPSVTPSTIQAAKESGIVYGVKSYPAGVTTHSDSGVVSYEPFYAIFAEIEKCDLVLNLHGEMPGADVFEAEELFLDTLKKLHHDFPRLRIVLEHCTTDAAVKAVGECGPNVVGTITAHHLFLTRNDVVGDPWHFCKPVAKHANDRDSLVRAAVSSDGKFFFGSDSAPHPVYAKRADRKKAAAGVFTQPYTTQLVVEAFENAFRKGTVTEEDVTEEKLAAFLGISGRRFYKLPRRDESRETIKLTRDGDEVVDVVRKDSGGVEVVPFRRGEKTWRLEWRN